MGRPASFIQNVAWNHAAKFIDFGFLYLARVVVARTLGPANDSTFALFTSLATILITVSSLGTDWMMYKFVPSYLGRNDRDGLASMLRFTFLLRLGVSTLCAGLVTAFVCSPAFPALHGGTLLPGIVVPMAVFVVGQSLFMLGTAIFTSMMKMRVVGAATLGGRVLLLTAIGVLATTGQLTAIRAIITFAVAAVISGAAYMIWLRPHMAGARVSAPVKTFMSYGAVILVNDLAALVIGRQSDVLILSAWFPRDPSISFYENGYQLCVFVEYFFTVGLTGVLFATYAKLANDDRAKLGAFHHQLLQFLSLVYVPAATIIAFCIPGLIAGTYGTAFLPSVVIVQTFLLIDVFDLGVFGGGANAALLNTIGSERKVVVNRVSWGAANLCINLAIIPRYGGFGAIIATRGCSLGATIVEYYIARRTVGGRFSVRTPAMAFLASAIAGGVVVLLPRETLLGAVIACCVGGTTVACVYFVMKPPAVRLALDGIRSRGFKFFSEV